MAIKNLQGQRFGRLIVLGDSGERRHRKVVWLCECECGNITRVLSTYLLKGDTKSCGCFDKERRVTHGMSGTRIYKCWADMHNRCYNSNLKVFKWYGAKGIAVCDEWKGNFKAFYDWAMSSGYTDDLTLDRIDSDGDYCPENCRWVTQSENCFNSNMKRWHGIEETV